MGDVNRGALGDEDRLPWLEAVEDEEEGAGVGAGKLVAAVIAALVALGLVVGGIFWVRQRAQPQGDGTLIAAPQGDYKVLPNAAEANMSVEGEGDATYAASQGANVSSTIDVTKLPEAPVTGGVTSSDATGTKALPPATAKPILPAAPVVTAKPEVKAPPKPKPEVKAVEAKPVEAKPAKVAAPEESIASGPGLSKQIGAYSSQTKAEAGRSDLTGRFPALHGLSLSIREGDSHGKTVYRIFMKGPAPKVEAVCKALHSAREGCIPG
jgi:cell division protein FtsN